MARSNKNDSELDGATPEMAGDTTAAEPDRERVAMRAYELYLARGGADGQAEEDWFNAERELLKREPTTRES